MRHRNFIICLALLLCTCLSIASAEQAQNMTVYDFQSETQMLWEAQVETHYATLSAEEIYASYGLIEAMNSADLSLEAAQANYEVASGIHSCDELRAHLTGFIDPYDPSYREDQAILDRLDAILTVCGLQRSDYCFQVQRNMAGIPDGEQAVNWTCNLKVFEKGEEYIPHVGQPDIQIVLSGEEMKVVSFMFTPHKTTVE